MILFRCMIDGLWTNVIFDERNDSGQFHGFKSVIRCCTAMLHSSPLGRGAWALYREVSLPQAY
jgi:hypothetical protein